jgi:hypothetical protein
MLPQVAYRTIGMTLLPIPLQPVMFKHLKQINRLSCYKFSVSVINNFEFMPAKGSIKKRYLKKFPLIRTAEDGTTTVEGVSNKQIPCPVPWKEPKSIERFRPGEHASGDLGDVRSLINEKSLELSEPKVEYELSEDLLESPPEVKRVRDMI